MAFLVVFIGLVSLLVAWVLPMVSDHIHHRLQIALLLGALALIIGGAFWASALGAKTSASISPSDRAAIQDS